MHIGYHEIGVHLSFGCNGHILEIGEKNFEIREYRRWRVAMGCIETYEIPEIGSDS